VANPGTRIGSIRVLASADPEGGGKDDESSGTSLALLGQDEAPASETRPLEVGRPCALRVFMCLRAPDAPERAWLTVTSDEGATLFEGWLLIEDGVQIELDDVAPTQTRLVRLLLETERWHRQAHVTLTEGLNEHVFV
jgi:hypothetical protein